MLTFLPCIDSDKMAESRKKELQIERQDAMILGATAVAAVNRGSYFDRNRNEVDIRELVAEAVAAKVSIPPERQLELPAEPRFETTAVCVANETSFIAAKRWVDEGKRPLVLNFAHGTSPGGGFLTGSKAQEEVLCRSSALYKTLDGDAMYEAHKERPMPDSTDWAIYSPDVPVFRSDAGEPLDAPWLTSFLTCAAPVVGRVSPDDAVELLHRRIERVLEISRYLGYRSLVLGAWGCGAFKNDPIRTARSFRYHLEKRFLHAFEEIIFAIADWSPERKTLGPFRDTFRWSD